MKVEGAMVEVKENSRKVLKPIMEKKRRERINSQLEQLKALVCKGKDKLEKADILELTVVHLKGLMQPRSQPSGEDGYKAGYSRCAQEFAEYISACHDLPSEARARILSNFGRTFGGSAACMRPVAPAPVALPTAVIILPAATAAQCERPTASTAVSMPFAHEYGRLVATSPSAAMTEIKAGAPAGQNMWRPW